MKIDRRSAWQRVRRVSRRLPVLALLAVLGTGIVWAQPILHAGTAQFASPSNPAIFEEALEIYCSGLGDGSSVIPPEVTIGGQRAVDVR